MYFVGKNPTGQKYYLIAIFNHRATNFIDHQLSLTVTVMI